MKERQGFVVGLAVVGVVLAGAFLLGAPSQPVPLDPRSDEPGGTSALVALLRELGASVDLDPGQPTGDVDVALVLRDRFRPGEREELLEWVDRGGVLVVSDPSSDLVPDPSGFGDLVEDGEIDDDTDDPADQPEDDPGQPSSPGLDLSVELRPEVCDIAALDEQALRWIEVYGGSVDYRVNGTAQSCFGSSASAYVVATPEGDGTVVALGGSGILVNRTLDEGDNAPVAATLLAPREGTRVAVLDPRLPLAGDREGDETLWGLVPDGVKRGVVQLGVAFGVYVLWRSRRLGKPVPETQPVKVAGSELVSAVGGLLERSKSPQHAADLLRADLRRDLIARLGVPANVPTATLAQVVADRTRLDEARLQAALGPGPVTDDRDLLAVTQLIDHVRKEAFDHVGS